MNRTWKQISFGSIYLLILALVIGGIYFFYLKSAPSCSDNRQNQKETGADCGGPCIPCEVKNLSLITEEVKMFPAGGGQITLLAKVSNPSRKFTARFSYQFNVEHFSEDSFWLFRGERQAGGKETIGPGATEYIVIPALSPAHQYQYYRNISLSVSELNWIEVESLPPDIGIARETNIDGSRVTVPGALSNKSASNLGSINLTAVLFDKEGNILNASLTRLEKIEAFSQEPFVVFFPEVEGLAERADPEKTKIQWDLVDSTSSP